MSDLSLPPLSLVPLDGQTMPPRAAQDRPDAFAWPTPPYASYPGSSPLAEAEQCEIEGLNGRTFIATLLEFDPAAGSARMLVPPSRQPVALKFAQFRRLTLLRSLDPLQMPAQTVADDVLHFRGECTFRVALRGGGEIAGRTVGHLTVEAGLYLFLPLDAAGRVQRVFVPAAAIAHSEFGPKLGEVLVEQNSATPAQITQALVEQQRLRDQRLGETLLAQRIVTSEQLEAALGQQSQMPMMRVGEALIGMGYISQSQLDEALAQQKQDRGTPLGALLVRAGHVTPSDLRIALARKMGYPVVDLERFPIERDMLMRVPHAVARRLRMLPLLVQRGRVIVAVEDPSRGDSLDEIEFLTQCKAVPVLASEEAWPESIDRAYAKFGLDAAGIAMVEATAAPESPGADQLLAALEQNTTTAAENENEEPAIEQSDNSLVRLINAMIVDAHAQGASDIHIECTPGRGKVRIRFRRDGGLKPYMELPHTHRSALIARLKIMCDLDISEKRRPQDGKINFTRFVPGLALELRVATIPTANGLEDAVLRLLASAKPIPLDKLGLSPANFDALIRAVERPYGMVLCVGPTGSGKTTTLHSALSRINTPERKIWTAEDPVEITQAGLRQVQVNPKIEWTFAKALRAFLRADPDVIMVGEIRDTETAQIAVEASLTGHLVLSTLHTNSAPETVTRLLDMGLDPFSFADSLLAVLAQRLAKRLCPKCRTSTPATEAEIEAWLDEYLHPFTDAALRPGRDTLRSEWERRFGAEGRLQRYHAPGCPHCDKTGYRGRAGLHELLVIDRELRRLVQTGARVEQLQAAGMAAGMRTLRQDGIEKMLAGVTSLDEVRATSNH